MAVRRLSALSISISRTRFRTNARKLNLPFLPTLTQPAQFLAATMTSEADPTHIHTTRAPDGGSAEYSERTLGGEGVEKRINKHSGHNLERLIKEGNLVEAGEQGLLSSASSVATEQKRSPLMEPIQQGAEDQGDVTAQGGGVMESLGVSGGVAGQGGRDREDLGEVEGLSGEDDKYLYLQRGFTSEIFKIEIQNIPKYIGYTELKKKLDKLGLKPVKIKKPQRFQKLPHCFVTFRSEEDREVALKVLDGQIWKGKPITAKVAAPSVDPLYRQKGRNKREAGGELSGDGCSAKRLRLDQDTHLTLQQRLNRVVTPLLGTSYETQLATKVAKIRLALRRAAYLIQKEDSNPGVGFAEQVKRNEGMMCQLKPILGSPLQTGYRNKVELSVGINPDKRPVVGFRLGSYEDGNFTVASPENCVHIPDKMKDLCEVFQEFFEQSPLPPYVASDESGFWRQVAVRCYGTGESMAVVMIHPQTLTKEELATEKKQLVDFFTTGPGSRCRPTSLYFHTFARRTKDQTLNIEHLLGEKHVHENILGLQFRISPDAFFQTNSPATEVLYRQVHDFCSRGDCSKAADTTSSSSQPPTIYDICCGTGTIGLYLAKALPARRVVGVEMNEQAIEDARANAELNGIEDVEFVWGKAEDVLQKQLEEYGAGPGEVIGVVDPPRAGLHPRVVQCIRKCSHIRKLVYVSCNPEGQMTLGNFVDLCRRPSLRVKGTPFSPVAAVPVDLFPHTTHCELVVLFQRSGTAASSDTANPNHNSNMD